MIFSAAWNQSIWSYAILLLFSPFVLTFLITTLRSWQAVAASRKAATGEKRPPTLPTAVPVFGHIIQFLNDGNRFISNAINHFGSGTPCGINMVAFSSYFVSGPEAISAFLKDPSRGLSQTSRSRHIIEHAFGCPHEYVELFGPQADPELQHKIHSNLQDMVSGAGLEKLGERFQEEVISQISSGKTGMTEEWTELPDLCAFVERQVLEAAIRAVFGPILVELSPDFAEHFWEFNLHVKSLFMGLPTWLNPAAIRARDIVLEDVRRWLRFVREKCDPNSIPDDVEWEPFYGSRTTRIRQQLLTTRGIVDESARAAENLANIWATNANSIPAATWFLLEALFDPALQARMLQRLSLAQQSGGEKESKQAFHRLKFDIHKLTNDDLLQSVYAETLRLRVAVLIVRQPTKDNFSIAGWHIKQNEVVSLSTRSELMNQAVWNAGTSDNPHPLKEFWAERFLVDPNVPSSGPLREAKPQKTGGRTEPYFSLEGCNWNWIPFGGGRSLCPGRQFAKREIMLTSALLLTAFDIELKTSKKPDSDFRVFGFGTMPANAKVPCRIRLRPK